MDQRQLKETSGVHIDMTSKSVVLIGDDVVDMLFDAVSHMEITPEVVTAMAVGVVRHFHPEYIDPDPVENPWSLGADDSTIEYLKTKLWDEKYFEFAAIKSDGGVDNGSV